MCAQRNGFKNNARRPLPSDTERRILKYRLVPSVILARLFLPGARRIPDAGAKTRDPSWQPREGDKQGSAAAFLAFSRAWPPVLDGGRRCSTSHRAMWPRPLTIRSGV